MLCDLFKNCEIDLKPEKRGIAQNCTHHSIADVSFTDFTDIYLCHVCTNDTEMHGIPMKFRIKFIRRNFDKNLFL